MKWGLGKELWVQDGDQEIGFRGVVGSQLKISGGQLNILVWNLEEG